MLSFRHSALVSVLTFVFNSLYLSNGIFDHICTEKGLYTPYIRVYQGRKGAMIHSSGPGFFDVQTHTDLYICVNGPVFYYFSINRTNGEVFQSPEFNVSIHRCGMYNMSPPRGHHHAARMKKLHGILLMGNPEDYRKSAIQLLVAPMWNYNTKKVENGTSIILFGNEECVISKKGENIIIRTSKPKVADQIEFCMRVFGESTLRPDEEIILRADAQISVNGCSNAAPSTSNSVPLTQGSTSAATSSTIPVSLTSTSQTHLDSTDQGIKTLSGRSGSDSKESLAMGHSEINATNDISKSGKSSTKAEDREVKSHNRVDASFPSLTHKVGAQLDVDGSISRSKSARPKIASIPLKHPDNIDTFSGRSGSDLEESLKKDQTDSVPEKYRIGTFKPNPEFIAQKLLTQTDADIIKGKNTTDTRVATVKPASQRPTSQLTANISKEPGHEEVSGRSGSDSVESLIDHSGTVARNATPTRKHPGSEIAAEMTSAVELHSVAVSLQHKSPDRNADVVKDHFAKETFEQRNATALVLKAGSETAKDGIKYPTTTPLASFTTLRPTRTRLTPSAKHSTNSAVSREYTARLQESGDSKSSTVDPETSEFTTKPETSLNQITQTNLPAVTLVDVNAIRLPKTKIRASQKLAANSAVVKEYTADIRTGHETSTQMSSAQSATEKISSDTFNAEHLNEKGKKIITDMIEAAPPLAPYRPESGSVIAPVRNENRSPSRNRITPSPKLTMDSAIVKNHVASLRQKLNDSTLKTVSEPFKFDKSRPMENPLLVEASTDATEAILPEDVVNDSRPSSRTKVIPSSKLTADSAVIRTYAADFQDIKNLTLNSQAGTEAEIERNDIPTDLPVTLSLANVTHSPSRKLKVTPSPKLMAHSTVIKEYAAELQSALDTDKIPNAEPESSIAAHASNANENTATATAAKLNGSVDAGKNGSGNIPLTNATESSHPSRTRVTPSPKLMADSAVIRSYAADLQQNASIPGLNFSSPAQSVAEDLPVAIKERPSMTKVIPSAKKASTSIINEYTSSLRQSDDDIRNAQLSRATLGSREKMEGSGFLG